jgi:hypothetical protein
MMKKLILALLLFCTPLLAQTTNIFYADKDSAGGNGTTNALSGANAAFASLAALVASRAAANSNLVTSNTIEEWIVDSTHANHTADTTKVTVTGFTTDATRYIYIHTPAASRHVGIWDDTKYRLVVTDDDAMLIREDYVRVDGLQLSTVTPTANYRNCVNFDNLTATTNAVWISNSICKGHGSATYRMSGIYNAANNVNGYFWNDLIYNLGSEEYSSGFTIGAASSTFNIYSTTIISATYGIRISDGVIVAKNVYASGTSGSAISAGVTKTTCATSDTTGTAGLQNIAVNTTNFTSVSGTVDYRLPLGSGLIDVGTNTSAESAPMNFTTDIRAFTRSVPWDIGMHEYGSAAASTLHNLSSAGAGF